MTASAKLTTSSNTFCFYGKKDGSGSDTVYYYCSIYIK